MGIYNDFDYIRKNISTLDNIKTIAKGNFATIKLITAKKSGKTYAVKEIMKYKIVEMKDFIEMKIIKCRKIEKHENIIELYDNFEDNEHYYLVFEYLPNGTLKDKIRNKKYYLNDILPFEENIIMNKKYNLNGIIPFEENTVILIFKQILNGLKYLHKLGIIHRDINPNNILFDVGDNAKITNFGLSSLLNKNQKIIISKDSNQEKEMLIKKTDLEKKDKTYNRLEDTFDGDNQNLISEYSNEENIDYSSPEIINQQEYNEKCDIYYLGKTIFRLMNLDFPHVYNIYNNENIRKKNNINIYKTYSNELRNLIDKMISQEPGNRPTAEEAYNCLINIEKNKSFNQNNINNNNNIFNNNISNNNYNNIIININKNINNNIIINNDNNNIINNDNNNNIINNNTTDNDNNNNNDKDFCDCTNTNCSDISYNNDQKI